MNIIDIFADINECPVTEVVPSDPTADAASVLAWLAEQVWLEHGHTMFHNMTVHIELEEGISLVQRLHRQPYTT